MGMGTDTRRELVEKAITEAWPDNLGQRLLDAVHQDEAFGALAWRVAEAYREGRDPAALWRELDPDTVEWLTTDADNPAAYLARRLTD